jgi:hypothetical protein
MNIEFVQLILTGVCNFMEIMHFRMEMECDGEIMKTETYNKLKTKTTNEI